MVICFRNNNQLKQYFLFTSQPRPLKCLWNKHFHVSIPLQFIKPMFQTPILRCPLYSPACTPTHALSQHHAPSTTNSYSSKVRLPLASSFSPLPTLSPELSLLEPWRLGPYRASPALDTSWDWGCFQSLSRSSAVPSKGTGDTIYSSNISSAPPTCWELGTRWQLRQASPHALELTFQQERQTRKNTVISDGDNCCEK